MNSCIKNNSLLSFLSIGPSFMIVLLIGLFSKPFFVIIIVLLCFNIDKIAAAVSEVLKIDLSRLQCHTQEQKFQLQQIDWFLPFGLRVTMLGLKTKDRYQFFLPAVLNPQEALQHLEKSALQAKHLKRSYATSIGGNLEEAQTEFLSKKLSVYGVSLGHGPGRQFLVLCSSLYPGRAIQGGPSSSHEL